MGEREYARNEVVVLTYVGVLSVSTAVYTWWLVVTLPVPPATPPVILMVAWGLGMAAANVLPIRWTGWRDPGSVHVGEGFALAPLLVGPSAAMAVLVVAVGHVGGVVLGARYGDGVIRYRLRARHLLFGLAQQVGAAAVTGHVLHASGLTTRAAAGEFLVPAIVATTVYVLVGDAVLAVVRILQGRRDLVRLVASFFGAASVSVVVATVLLYPIAVASTESVGAGLAGTVVAVGLLAILSQAARRQYLAERTLAGIMDFTVQASSARTEQHVVELLEPAGRFLLDRHLTIADDGVGAEHAVIVRRSGDEETWLVAREDETSQRRLSSGWERTVMGSLAAVTRAVLDAAAARQRIRRLADHDALTGLVNRRRFEKDAERVLQRVATTGGTATLLYVDLNGFKAVNDRISHDAGDDVLVEAARRLESTVRPGDLVSRRGGDEFTVLLEGDASLVQRCCDALADLPHGVSGAVGAVHFPDDGADLGALLALADQRMYEVKAAFRDGRSPRSVTPAART